MTLDTVLYIINRTSNYGELMYANTIFLEYVLNNSLKPHELDQLYNAYSERKQLLKLNEQRLDVNV